MFQKFLAGLVSLMLLAVFGFSVSPANASELIGRDARNIVLQVNEHGEALVSYISRGKQRRVLVWGAMNAVVPITDGPQVKFEVDYSGGWQKYYLDDPKVKVLQAKYRKLRSSGKPYLNSSVVKELSAKSSFARNYWKDSFKSPCAKYDGPRLAWFVVGCKAPDSSYWAIQSWQRGLSSFGQEPTPLQRGWELRLSHWRGGLSTLTVYLDWAYRRFHHLYGALTYRGVGVAGLGSNIYVDTYNSNYGSGWRRENSFRTHRPNGTFCYGFYLHAGFPSGMGKRYRATAIGPGVTPDVLWEGVASGHYDSEADLADLERQREFLTGDSACKPL